MCSIMGYCGVCDDLEAFQKGFAKTISRGPDDSRIVDTGKWSAWIPQTCDYGAYGIRDAAVFTGWQLCGMQWRDFRI